MQSANCAAKTQKSHFTIRKCREIDGKYLTGWYEIFIGFIVNCTKMGRAGNGDGYVVNGAENSEFFEYTLINK